MSERERESVLEDVCDRIVDVIYETFTKKYYSIRISQAKNGNIFLIVRKKRRRLIDDEKTCLRKKIKEIISFVYGWFCNKSEYLCDYYFLDFKLIKQCSY